MRGESDSVTLLTVAVVVVLVTLGAVVASWSVLQDGNVADDDGRRGGG